MRIKTKDLCVNDVFREIHDGKELPFQHSVVREVAEKEVKCFRPYVYARKIDGQISYIQDIENFWMPRDTYEVILVRRNGVFFSE